MRVLTEYRGEMAAWSYEKIWGFGLFQHSSTPEKFSPMKIQRIRQRHFIRSNGYKKS
jgi:hypothetical protein